MILDNVSPPSAQKEPRTMMTETQTTEDELADKKALELIRARYLKRLRIGLALGISFLVLLAYVIRP